MWDNLDLFIPGQSDKLNLQNFNNFLNKAIRQVDNETLIFFEVGRLCVVLLSEHTWLSRPCTSLPQGGTCLMRRPWATRRVPEVRATTIAQYSAIMYVPTAGVRVDSMC